MKIKSFCAGKVPFVYYKKVRPLISRQLQTWATKCEKRSLVNVPGRTLSAALLSNKLIMRINLIALLVVITLSQALGSGYIDVYGQTVNIRERNAPLEKVFAQIEKQTGFVFFYEDADVKDVKVTVDLQGASLETVLTACLKKNELTYRIDHRNVFVARRAAFPKVRLPGTGNLQWIEPAPQVPEVKGRISDSLGNPLEQAAVIIKGTREGTHTNVRGEFVLQGAKAGDILMVTYIGYKPVEVKIQDLREYLYIVLRPTNDLLDEIQIIGYGTTSRRLSTGSVSTVTAEDIEKQPVSNVLQALMGRVPGLEVTQSSGYASAPFSLKIRGDKSLFSNVLPGEPLYIVDGVPIMVLGGQQSAGGLNVSQNGFPGPAGGLSPLYSLNPLDIQSIDILKDADATAIYGSRAANGVVLITTKRPTAGASRFSVNAYTGVSASPRRLRLLNTSQYLAMRREAFVNDAMEPEPYNAIDLLSWDSTRYTDWQKKISRSSVNTDVKIDYSGGNQNTSFRIGGGYHIETTPVPKEVDRDFHDYRLNTLLSLIHTSFNRKFSLNLNVNFAYANTNLPGEPFANYFLPPNAPALLDAAGQLNWSEWGSNLPYSFSGFFQPYQSASYNTIANLVLKYQLYRGLSLSTSIGYTGLSQDQKHIMPKSAQDPENSQWNTNSSQFGTNNSNSWIVEPQLNYQTQIGLGSLQALLGGTFQETISKGTNLTASGFSNEDLMESIAAASTVVGRNNYAQYRYQGVFGRLTYNLLNRYIIDGSIRRDGSSRFKSGRQMGNFGAVGASWIFSEEPWLKRDSAVFSFGKLRGSYGATGSAGIADYLYYDLWNPNEGAGGMYDGRSTLLQVQPYNTDFGWQVNRKLEFALELGFINNRILASVAWYREMCDNQLVSFPLPEYTGFNSVTANWPAEVENRGWEFTLNSTNIQAGNFSWTTSFNISTNKNKLLSYPDFELSPYTQVYKIGAPLSIKYLLHYTGVNSKTGAYDFEDLNGDGQITNYNLNGSSDLKPMYNTAPKYFGGIQNALAYKGIQLSFFFEFKKQTGPYAVYQGVPGTLNNQPIAVLDRWQKEGDVTDIPKYATFSSFDYSNFLQSDAFMSDASYIRLQNLSLGYSLPDSWLKRLKVSQLRVYFQGQNLWTITHYKGIDPASPSLNNLFPPRKFFTGGLQITF